MAHENLLSQIWDLKANPFNPFVEDGESLGDKFLNTIDPKQDKRLLRFYHDHYDWEKTLSKESIFSADGAFTGFLDINKIFDSEETHLVLILGDGRRNGVRSLKNLIFYQMEMALESAASPILVPARLTQPSKSEALKVLARSLIYAYTRELPNPTRQDLRDILEDYRSETEANVIQGVFQLLRDEIRAVTNRPIGIDLMGSENDHMDIWELIFESVQGLATLVIATTTKESQAESCLDKMGGKNVSLIRADGLDITKARAFLLDRFSKQRSLDPADLTPQTIEPFTDPALDAIYEKGTQVDMHGANKLTHSIGQLSKIFRWILDDYLIELEKRLNDGTPSNGDEINTRSFLITPELVRTCLEARS